MDTDFFDESRQRKGKINEYTENRRSAGDRAGGYIWDAGHRI